MNEQHFDELLDSVRDMGRHMRGDSVQGLRVREFPEPDVKAIREPTGLSQSRFAYLIGINPKTLQNWEQKRVRPTGPARALLKIIEVNLGAHTAIHA
ncbi:DNA-binding transcriptional regulator [Halomonas sp. PR-M31]|uniref:helix-turn-helix domain-containing protein n=1 Tax=Halomonas sp. PR-M31 TaxID=1471202 RepID=UPI000650C104|nr:helix-turn-helix domain-containing protein [Halomonas sp. PR-M31]